MDLSPRSVGKRCRVAVDMSQIAATDQAAALQAAAQRLIADGCSWITASQLAQWAGVSPATLDQWKRDKRIFSVMRQGIEVFPEYLFDAQHRSLPAVEATLLLLHEYDGDRLAAWFESTSSFLGGRRPRELLAADPQAGLRRRREMPSNARDSHHEPRTFGRPEGVEIVPDGVFPVQIDTWRPVGRKGF